MAANLVATSLRAYSLDRDRKYPPANNLAELLKVLQEERYLDKAEVDRDDFGYMLVDNKIARLSFSNSVLNKDSVVELVGPIE
jgi:hypothetical protein